jgi:lipopolysaccharide transport system permease protein
VQVVENPIDQLPVIVLTPARPFPTLGLRELWEYRELIAFLAWRDVKVRYQQTILGVVWALIQPLVPMVIFAVVFGRLAKLPSEGAPYPVFVLAGLLPWQLFSSALANSSNSVVSSSALLTKVYFPRLIIPMSAVLSGLVDFAISFVLLLTLMTWYGLVPTASLAVLPAFMVLALATALGIGLWGAALNVQYRDVQYLVPFVVQAWMYASPVAYSATLIPAGPWKVIYGLNPMTGVIQGFRWSLLGTEAPSIAILLPIAISLLLFASGILYFRWMEDRFADII